MNVQNHRGMSTVGPARGAICGLAILASLLAGLPVGRAHAQDTEIHSFVYGTKAATSETPEDIICDYELMKLIRQYLGDSYQDLQIVITGCNGGGFATQAQSGPYSLQGNWSLTTMAEQGQINKVRALHGDTYQGQQGLYGGYNDKGMLYYYGFKPQWIKSMGSDPAATAQSLFNDANSRDWDPSGEDFVCGGTGATGTVHGGAESNHAIVWGPKNDKTTVYGVSKRETILDDKPQVTTVMDGLIDAGYTHRQSPDDGDPNNYVDFAWSEGPYKHVTSPGGNTYQPDRTAKKKDLEDQLKAMGEKLAANPGKEKAFIFLNAHGSTKACTVPVDPVIIPTEPGGKNASLDLESRFVEDMLTDVIYIDDERNRVSQPMFALTTTYESFAGPVGVYLDNIPIGAVELQGAMDGGDYVLSIQDTSLNYLYNTGAFDDLSIDVRFSFDPDEFFLVATPDDLDFLPHLSGYGIGLLAPGTATVPEPATLALLAAGALAGLALRLRRKK